MCLTFEPTPDFKTNKYSELKILTSKNLPNRLASMKSKVETRLQKIVIRTN